MKRNICFKHSCCCLRELGNKMTVCPKYEIACGSEKKAQKLICLAADATRKVVNKQFSKMCSAVKPQASFKFRISNNVQQTLLLPIRGVARFSETLENKTFSTPRARPEQVRFGPRTRRLFRRPLQRTVRFELFGTLAAESLNPFSTNTKRGGLRNVARNDVFCTCVRTGMPKRVARIELKPARAAIRNPNCAKARKLCMYVMI